jgi:hypothetical protein
MALTVGVNSWVTVAEADAYLADKYGAGDWAGLPNATKESLLITSYRWIQRLQDYSISPASTNIKVKSAQIELAWYIYNNSTQDEKRRALQAQGVEEFKLGKWEEKLGTAQLPFDVQDLLSDFLLNAGGYFPEFQRDLE